MSEVKEKNLIKENEDRAKRLLKRNISKESVNFSSSPENANPPSNSSSPGVTEYSSLEQLVEQNKRFQIELKALKGALKSRNKNSDENKITTSTSMSRVLRDAQGYLPIYNGEGSPIPFLDKCDAVFEQFPEASENTKIFMARSRLIGAASNMGDRHADIHRQQIDTWANLKAKILARFSQIKTYEQVADEFYGPQGAQKPNETLEEYYQRFLTTFNEFCKIDKTDNEEQRKLRQFIKGIYDTDLHRFAEQKNATKLDDIWLDLKIYESQLNIRPRRSLLRPPILENDQYKIPDNERKHYTPEPETENKASAIRQEIASKINGLDKSIEDKVAEMFSKLKIGEEPKKVAYVGEYRQKNYYNNRPQRGGYRQEYQNRYERPARYYDNNSSRYQGDRQRQYTRSRYENKSNFNDRYQSRDSSRERNRSWNANRSPTPDRRRGGSRDRQNFFQRSALGGRNVRSQNLARKNEEKYNPNRSHSRFEENINSMFFIRDNGPPLILHVKINNEKTVPAFFDSGCSTMLIKQSICTEEMLQQLRPTNVRIRSANMRVKLMGEIKLKISLGRNEFWEWFQVVNDSEISFIPYGILITMEFFKKNGMYFSKNIDEIICNGEKFPLYTDEESQEKMRALTYENKNEIRVKPNYCRSARNQVIPPKSLNFIEVKLDNYCVGDFFMIAREHKNPQISTIEAAYKVASDVVHVALVNTSEDEVIINKHDQVGKLIPFTFSDIAEDTELNNVEEIPENIKQVFTIAELNEDDFLLEEEEAMEFKNAKPEDIHLPRTERVINKMNFEGLTKNNARQLKQLVREFSDIFVLKGERLACYNKEVISIPLKDNEPVYQKNYPVPNRVLPYFKKELQDLEEAGIIERADSPYASPAFMLLKVKDGQVVGTRLLVDYREINSKIVDISHPIPLIPQLISKLANSKIFSSVDLSRAFNQCRLDYPSSQALAMSTPFGQYRWVSLSFGTKAAGTIFQRIMDRVVKPEHGTPYIDDIIVDSEDWPQHLIKLRGLFESLRDAGLRLNPEKTILGREEINYLGYQISAKGIQPTDEKVQKILDIPVPKTVKQVKAFVGALLYYKAHIKDLQRILIPLYELTKAPKGTTLKTGNKRVIWSEKCQEAFEKAKQSLAAKTRLAHLKEESDDISCPVLTIDSSAEGAGVVLSQIQYGVEVPIAFASKKFPEAARSNPSWRLELRGLIFALKHFRHQIYLRRFRVVTDARCLVYLRTAKHLAGHLQRYQILLSDFGDFEITHIGGAQNRMADLLSRIRYDMIPPTYADDIKQVKAESYDEWAKRMGLTKNSVMMTNSKQSDTYVPKQKSSLKPESRKVNKSDKQVTFNRDATIRLNYVQANNNGKNKTNDERTPNIEHFFTVEEIIEHQEKDKNIKEARWRMEKGKSKVRIEKDERGVVFRVNKQAAKLWVPKALARDYVARWHASPFRNHAGKQKEYMALVRNVYIPKIGELIDEIISQCEICQKTKSNFKPLCPPLKLYQVPNQPFDRIHLDFMTISQRVGEEKYPYALIMVCAFSKFTKIIPCKTQTAGELVKRFMRNVIGNFGTPSTIITDNGPCFKSELWGEVCRKLGANHRTISPYNAKGNGQAENGVRRVKEGLRLSMASNAKAAWTDLIPYIELSLNNSYHESIKATPFQIMYGRDANIIGEQILKFKTSKYNDEELTEGVYDLDMFAKIWSDTRLRLEKHGQQMKESYDKKVNIPSTMNIGDQVWLKKENLVTNADKMRNPRFEGPFRIISIASPNVKLRNVETGKVITTVINRIKRLEPKKPSPYNLRSVK